MEPTVRTLSKSFERHLLATNRSARTVQTYLCAVEALAVHLEAEGLPDRLRSIRRTHLEAFVAARLSKVKAATVSVQFRALQQFFHVGGNRGRGPILSHGQDAASYRPGDMQTEAEVATARTTVDTIW